MLAKTGTSPLRLLQAQGEAGLEGANLCAGVFRIIAWRIYLWRAESEAQGLSQAILNILKFKAWKPWLATEVNARAQNYANKYSREETALLSHMYRWC